jgi:hypothetical protein
MLGEQTSRGKGEEGYWMVRYGSDGAKQYPVAVSRTRWG